MVKFLKDNINNLYQKVLIVGLLIFAAWFTIQILNLAKAGFNEPVVTAGGVFALITAELGYLMTLSKTDKNNQGGNSDG